ncbi:hypothetical protein A3203_26525 [Burkholderia cenocepacia]|nr:hypothetical protein A3203_26525 [Burkholderia cenocepacia]
MAASCGPTVQKRAGSVNSCDHTELWKPPVADSVSVGKNAAIATPICSFAAAARRSAAAMSGRRSRIADGTSTGVIGGSAASGFGGSEKVDAGSPISVAIACSYCARATPLSICAACALCSCVCAWITSARAATPCAYWFCVSCSDRWYDCTVSSSSFCSASDVRNWK